MATRYEFNIDDLHALANSIGAETKIKGDELFFKKCPYCNGSGHDDYTFSVNMISGAYNCFRASCGSKGHFVELARDFNFPLGNIGNSKVYKSLPQDKKPTANENVYNYMAKRGISKETVDRYKISADKTNSNNLVFPFYDADGILRFYKVRNMLYKKGVNKSKEWCSADCQPILFGMSQCVDFDTLVITEGQMDSLTLSECGIKNAVSVPTGANGFTWVEPCFDWVMKFKKIIVFGDYEYGFMTLIDKIRATFKKPILAVRRDDYLYCKDANDIYLEYGKNSVIKCIENAEQPPARHIKRLADVEDVDLNKLPRIFTGFYEVDSAIGGMYNGQVILLTGKRGEGKSTFMSQIVVSALEQRQRVLIYSGELHTRQVKSWVNLQVAGKKHIKKAVNQFGRTESYVTKEANKIINDWYRDYAYIYDNNDVENENDSLLEIVEEAVIRHDIKLVCIDNLMTAIDIDGNVDLYREQARFVKALAKLAKSHDIVIMLVAHPKKTQGEFNNDSVSGSSVITDAVDVVMNYENCRNNNPVVDSMLSITKNRLTGICLQGKNAVELSYAPLTKRITSVSHFDPDKEYTCFLPQKEKILLEEVPF